MNAGLTAAASGIFYWGWDIAGFSGEIPSAELYIRAMQASTFVPIMQYHSEFNHHRTPSRDRTPWNIAERTGDDRVLALSRRFITLREALVPYLERSARETITTDRPLMRPLFFDWPTDPAVWTAPTQWMLGADLLVAPVLDEGAVRGRVYLPEGEWIDVWTGESTRGGRSIEVETPIEQIPVFARAEASTALLALFRADG